MSLFRAFRFLAILVIVASGVPLQAQVLAPDKIAEKLKASTVLIEDLEGAGSGVVLTDTGLILTNLHVIGSGIDLKVKLNMRFGTKMALTELDQVKLLRVHPKYDLAVLQATAPAGAAFVPVEMAPKQEKLVTGSKCYVIGHPGGPDGKALEMSITEGLVSSASRTLEGLDYIQVSAAMNPGNSGGPVCDDRGRCIGIATLKMAQTEGIGFAIPTQKVVLSEFVERKDRPNDLALARELEHYAGQFLEAAKVARGADQQILWMNAIQFYRLCLAAAPNHPAPYNNLGVVYNDMGNKAMAKKYYEAAINLRPDYAASLHTLGVILINENPANEARCLDLWLKGLSEKEDRGAAALCAEDVAVLALTKRKFHALAYALRWASVLDPGPPSMLLQKRTNMWQNAEREIGPDDANLLRDYPGPFNRETFERLLKGEPFSAVKSTLAMSRSAGVSGATGAGAVLKGPTLEQMKEVANQATSKFKETQQPVPQGGLDLPLPDVVRNPILGNSGWQIIMPFKTLGKIGLFSLATYKFDGFIECSDPNVMCASGGHVLALYLPSTQTLELYDLNTLQKKASQRLLLKSHVAFVSMGLLNPMQLLAICESPTDRAMTSYIPVVIRLPGLEPHYPPLVQQGGNLTFFPVDTEALLDGGVDESGMVCAVRRLEVSPSGYAVYTLSGDGTARWSTEHIQIFNPRPSHFGSAVVCREQVMLGSDTKNVLEKQPLPAGGDYILAPIAGYPGMVARVSGQSGGNKPGSFRLFGLPQRKPLVEIFGDAATKGGRPSWNPDEGAIVMASAFSDRLVSIIPETKRIHILNLGLSGSAGKEDLARPGKLYQRKVQIASGSTVTLENGPKGLTFDAATGTISWQVPADIPTGQTVQVLLLVKTVDGKQDYQIEKILVP